MATMLSTMGCKVYMFSEESRILPKEDNTTRQWVTQGLKGQGVQILKRVKQIKVEKESGFLRVHLSGSEAYHIEVEHILICSRKPATESLGAEKAGIRIEQDGRIGINKRLESSVPGIYAVGDATGGWMFASAAMAMGVIAAENAMGESQSFPDHLIPRVIWSTPQVGSVGLSEKEAKKQGFTIQVGEFPYAVNGLAMAWNQPAGTVKIVSDARYGEILGVHIVGAHAAELIGEALLAMQLEATAQDLARGIRVHPSYSENVVDAARDVLDWALYLPKKR
jgi:dihydrolipoamide dehydrogenase